MPRHRTPASSVAAEPPSPLRSPLRAPHRLSRPTCALPVPRSCSRTQIRVKIGPGTPLAVFSDEAPPREHIAGESHRHPASHQVLAARSPSDGPKQIRPESTQADTGQHRAILQMRPRVFLESTRSPSQVKTISNQAQFLTFKPLTLLDFELAIQPLPFCELDPRVKV